MKQIYCTFCSNSKAETIIHDADIDMFESIYATIMTKIRNQQTKGSGWITDSVIDKTLTFQDKILKALIVILNCQKE